jgi:hypothetical protein
MATLYVARRSDAPHFLKVGRAKDVANRMRELQRGHVFTVTALAIFPKQGPQELEVHKRLRWCRVEGFGGREWFQTDLKTIVHTIASLLSAPPAEEGADDGGGDGSDDDGSDNSDSSDDSEDRINAALQEFARTLGVTRDKSEAATVGALRQAARAFVRERTGIDAKLPCKSTIVNVWRNGQRTSKRVCPHNGYAVLP